MIIPFIVFRMASLPNWDISKSLNDCLDYSLFLLDKDGLHVIEKQVFPGLTELLLKNNSSDVAPLESWDILVKLLGRYLNLFHFA